MKNPSIDQKLSSILELICNRDNIDPTSLKEHSPFSESKKDIQAMRSTIEYLKDYAKLQAIAQNLGNSEKTLQDIIEAQNSFAEKIQMYKDKIKATPLVRRKNMHKFAYGYADEMKAKEEQEYRDALLARRAKVADYRETIRLYESKIRKLESLKKNLDKPQKLMESLFPKEYTDIKENYAQLINMCVASMTDGMRKTDLIGDDKIFKKDGDNYTVNYNKARSFLAAIRHKDDLLAAAEYAKAAVEANEIDSNLSKVSSDSDRATLAHEETTSEEFAIVNDRMNQLISEFDKLDYEEQKAGRGSIFHRFQNSIRRVLGFEQTYARIPMYVIGMRRELSDNINRFIDEIKHDEKLSKAYTTYKIVTGDISLGAENTTSLEWASSNIAYNGTFRQHFPSETYTLEELQQKSSNITDYYTEKAESLQAKKEANSAKLEEIGKKLKAPAKKLLEKYSHQELIDMAETYGTNKTDSFFSSHMNPNSAAIILESLLGRKNISWETIAQNYANIIGNSKLEQERISIDEVATKKIDSLRELCTPTRHRRAQRDEEKIA